MQADTTPVLVGCGQLTDHSEPEHGASPIDLMAAAARKAADDTGAGDKVLRELEAVAAVGLVVDSAESGSMMNGFIANVPGAVSRRLGIQPGHQRYTHPGGNTPQMLVNRYAELIARGELSSVLLTGAEALKTMVGRLKKGQSLEEWRDSDPTPVAWLGEGRAAVTDHELLYGLQTPATTYPLFENALRGKYGWTLAEHQQHLGELYAEFNAVAVDNPLAWFPARHTPEDISTPSAGNRYVGFPYTKYLNSVIQVNQGAAVIMTSLAKARELGVAEDRMVYLHGCADAHDIWNVTERVNFHSSPAVQTMGEKALSMAGRSVDEMDFLDIYSCFPSAVQIACDELGIAHNDPRGLTVTGGLPYFGGPGNNYVMHSIATMMDRLREKPGSFGLLNANGWFITKHALGIYSTEPSRGPWRREQPSAYQSTIDAQAHPNFTANPKGMATIETYTILHGRKGVERGLVIGRQNDGTRFLAQLHAESEQLEALQREDLLGAAGKVAREGEFNLFQLN